MRDLFIGLAGAFTAIAIMMGLATIALLARMFW